MGSRALFFAALLALAGWSPAAAGDADTEVTLERTVCLGGCPVYRVTVEGDGKVVFESEGPEGDNTARRYPYVLAPGRHEYRIDPQAAARLFQRFRDADFFALEDEYTGSFVDQPHYQLTLRMDGRTKVVRDELGPLAALLDRAASTSTMPDSVIELEDAVDEAAGTERWIGGAVGLVAALEEQDFHFASKRAAMIAYSGVAEAPEATVLELIARGAPLKRKLDLDYRGKLPAGIAMVEDAIIRGRPAILARLAELGWLAKLDKARQGSLFAVGTAACSAEFVDRAAELGIPVDGVVLAGDAEFEEDAGLNARELLERSTMWCDGDEAREQATLRRLEDHGVILRTGG